MADDKYCEHRLIAKYHGVAKKASEAKFLMA